MTLDLPRMSCSKGLLSQQEHLPMKIQARVARGELKGEIVSPHRHADGTYVVSPTRFERDYIRVSTLEDVSAHVRQGLKCRMSSPLAKAPRLFAPASITIEN
jgi:hypothetical protein